MLYHIWMQVDWVSEQNLSVVFSYDCAKLLSSHFRSYKLWRIPCISPSLVGASVLLSLGNKLIVMKQLLWSRLRALHKLGVCWQLMFHIYFTCWQYTSSFGCNVGSCIQIKWLANCPVVKVIHDTQKIMGVVGYFVKTSRKVLDTFLPAIPLSAMCHEHFIMILYVIMLVHNLLQNELVIY